MRKALICLCVLAPALAVAQEKYTNADLRRAPRRDVYTNADVQKLAPLPTRPALAGEPEPMPPAPPDRATLLFEDRLADLELERDLTEEEIAWQWSLIDRAHSVGGGPNDWPLVGPDTAEARMRIDSLRRRLHMLEAELNLLRFGSAR